LIHFLQANRQTEGGHRVVVFVKQRLAVTILGGTIVFAFEIEVSHLDIFCRLVWIPRVKLIHLSVAGSGFGVLQYLGTLRMNFGVVRRGT
jgi:hypothetical protein